MISGDDCNFKPVEVALTGERGVRRYSTFSDPQAGPAARRQTEPAFV
jgi:hypothetical protein